MKLFLIERAAVFPHAVLLALILTFLSLILVKLCCAHSELSRWEANDDTRGSAQETRAPVC